MARAKASSKKKAEVIESTRPHPRQTAQLLGQEAAEGILSAARESGKMPHAWLICGAKGIGKATLAYQFARLLLSEGQGDESAAARRVISGSHTDLMVLESSQGADISIDETRKIKEFLSLTPAEGRWRVVIIDSVDDMNRQAANAILKTLEEPPANALLLLISHNPGMLLPTIRSRCRMLKLSPLKKEMFEQVLAQQDTLAGEAMIEAYHVFSGGSPGVALFLMEQEAIALYDALLSCFLPTKNAPDWKHVHALADQLNGKSEAARFEAFSYMLHYFFQQLVRAACAQPQIFLLARESEVVSALAATRDAATWLRVFEEISTLLSDIGRIHLDPKQVFLNIIACMQQDGVREFSLIQ